MSRKFHGPCAKSFGDSAKIFLDFEMTTKNMFVNRSDGNFCFSSNTVKTCSCGIKTSRNIQIMYLFHSKAYFQVHISCTLCKFLQLYKTYVRHLRSSPNIFFLRRLVLATGSLHASMKSLTKVYLFSV